MESNCCLKTHVIRVFFSFLVKPKILRETLTNTGVIKIGQSHTWSPELIGKPVPEKEWRIDGGDVITNNEKFTIVNEDFKTSLTIKNAVRKDTKLYRIKIENECGKDSELVDLVVLGPPGKPLGPLVVKDVRAESCKLVWKPPEDDGGCPIIDYDIEMMCPKTKQWKKVIK